VELAAMLVLAFELVDEIRWSRRRIARAASGWWADVERRERHRLHVAELGLLALRLPPPAKRARIGAAGRSGRRGLTRVG
jgi:hypothetical protein